MLGHSFLVPARADARTRMCPTCCERGTPRLLGGFQVAKPVLSMLKRVEPYVAFGYPNLKSVRELIYKRGYAKVRRRRRARICACVCTCARPFLHSGPRARVPVRPKGQWRSPKPTEEVVTVACVCVCACELHVHRGPHTPP